MPKPIASIIVPTLNEEKFIERTLKALLNQTVPKEKYEVIVSDSSSNDSTVKRARKLAGKVVVCERKGAGFGRNFGAKKARGKFIGFVDADTIVSKTWVEGLIESLEKGVGCTGPMESLEKDSLKLNLFYKFWGFQSLITTKLGFSIFPGFNIGVRAKEFKRVHGFGTENITTEDIGLGFKLRKLGPIVFSKKMYVKTSTRRVREISVIRYMLSGTSYVLFKKSRPWEKHRKDF